MKFLNPILLATLSILAVMVTAAPSRAQTKPQKVEGKASASPQSDAEKNVQAYIDLLLVTLQQQEGRVVGSVIC